MADLARTSRAPLGPPRMLAPGEMAAQGVGRSATPPTPAEFATMEREEGDGAATLMTEWDRSEELRKAADLALFRFNVGQGSAADAANAMQRYYEHRKTWIAPPPVNQSGWSLWEFLFGRAR